MAALFWGQPSVLEALVSAQRSRLGKPYSLLYGDPNMVAKMGLSAVRTKGSGLGVMTQ